MANELIIRNGFVSNDSSRIIGTLSASTISAGTFNGNIVALSGTSVTNPTYRTSLGGTNISPRATFGSEATGANLHRYIFDPVNQNGLIFSITNNGGVYIARGAIVAGGSGSVAQEIGDLRFFTLNTPNATFLSERMRLDHLGNLGIGTTSPSEKLDVVGKTKTTSIQITSGATNGYVLTSDVSGNSTWQQIPSFTGGTVSGETNFTNGLTANTISATTYQNLPNDVFITGGTFSSETITFTNNTGGTFSVSGISQTPIYQQSVWTSFQTSTRSVSSTNFGSGSGIAVPFYVNKSVTILNSKIECTGISTNPTNCEFGIYDVITGTVSNRLFHQVFQVSGTGLYTFTTNLTLQPGIYAYALTQDIILGWRSFTVSNNGLGVDSNIGANVFISGKSKASNNTPNPYGTQSNYNSNMPLAIFEIQI
jgi:hypothetical protein